MSGTRTAGKINLALMCLLTNLLYPENRESISTKANKTHTKDCTYAVFSDYDYCQTQCHTLVLLPALILQQPCTFHAVIMYSCTGLLHHMACNFQARTKGPGLKSITKCMKPQHTSQRKSELCLWQMLSVWIPCCFFWHGSSCLSCQGETLFRKVSKSWRSH